MWLSANCVEIDVDALEQLIVPQQHHSTDYDLSQMRCCAGHSLKRGDVANCWAGPCCGASMLWPVLAASAEAQMSCISKCQAGICKHGELLEVSGCPGVPRVFSSPELTACVIQSESVGWN